ncbi:unnamed protein product [Cochlearia groenlandica]
MDYFLIDSILQQEEEEVNLWDVIASEKANRSAFRSYAKDTEHRMMLPEISSSTTTTVNVKIRMVNLLRKNWEEKKNAVAPEKERSRRHMMKERSRREKQKQSYLALHSLLPTATKNGKNSIVEKTVDEIVKLKKLKRELERKMNVLATKDDDDEIKGTMIRFNIKKPLSGIDSMLEVLQCLKSMGTKLKTVQANFSPQEFSTTISITSQIRGEELENRVERRLHETEWKLLFSPQDQ